LIGVYLGVHPFLAAFCLGQHFFFQVFWPALISFRLVSVFSWLVLISAFILAIICS
jgi:hypothetical protein